MPLAWQALSFPLTCHALRVSLPEKQAGLPESQAGT